MVHEDGDAMNALHNVLLSYIPLIVMGSFLLISVTSYAIMFRSFLLSRREVTNSELTAWQAFRGSKFYIAVLLMTSFIVFWIAPMMIGRFINIDRRYYIYINISFIFSDTVDGIIYVFLKPSVNKLLREKLGCCVITRSRAGETNISIATITTT